MMWNRLLAAFLFISFIGCSYLPKRRRQSSGQGDYEDIKSEKVEDHKEDLKRLRGQEPSQLY
jgi:hypothetical protein